ncbi:cytochrome P450 4V2-like [Stegodyphus dumicola]|uniref:cytochrome P450 4V2-like n=1 Tax=Stegodyphus dumicola TaxID=202533 RepID=UPI0015A8C1F7|nr:cytochrome P450 4V2-like [Stegodyphus dumicola]
MSHIRDYSQLALYLYNTLRIILLVTALYLLLGVYLRRRRLVKIVNKLPALRLRFYWIFGHIHILLAWRFRKTQVSPHVYDLLAFNGYMQIFRKENVTNLWQFYIPFITVYKADSVEMILNHSTQLKKAWFYDLLHPWLGLGLLTSYNTKWKNRRKMLTPAFHFNILHDFLPVMNKESRILVEVLKKHAAEKYVEIVPLITKCSLDIICGTILGAEICAQTDENCPYLKALIKVSSAVFERMQRPWLWPFLVFQMTAIGRSFRENLKTLHDFTTTVIAEKKKEKLENKRKGETPVKEQDTYNYRKLKSRALLDLLLDEHINNNSITETEIREEVDTFTFEGHDTTSIAVCWCLYMIGLHPWIQDKIHDELDSIFCESNRDVMMDDIKDMKYLECVVKETLRLYPSVPGLAREITEDVEFHGRIIPKGATCVVFTYCLHRDPEVFPNPEKFDPDRFLPENSAGRHPFAYVPFSAGPRNCIGQRFALMEAKTMLSFILRKYHVRSLDPRDKVHVADEIILRPKNGIRIEIKPRSESLTNHPPFYYP